MDPWEIAFISIMSVIGLGIAVILMISFKSNLLDLIPVDSVVCTSILLMCALIPVMLFSTGFFTDTINQSFDYSKASIVGFVGLLVTMLVGSTGFADFSRKIVGWFPPVFKKSDVPGVPNEWNWWVAGLLLVIIGLPIGLGYGLNRSTWSKELTTGISVFIVIIALAGSGFLGKFSETVGGMKGGSTFTVNPFPEGLCDVPGFTWAHNPIAPSSVILTQTIAWYYMVKNWDTGNGSKNAGIGISSAIIFMLQWYILNLKGCLQSYNAGSWAPLLGYAISAGLGGAGYELIKNLPSFSGGGSGGPSVPPVPTPNGMVCPKGYVMSPSGDCVPKLGPGGLPNSASIPVGETQQEKSLPVEEDQDAFVCEAYKDGELVTSTIVD